MKRLTGTNKEIAELLYQEQLELSKENRDVESTVQAIIEDVKKRGDEALRDYSAKFDKVGLTDFEVGQDLIDQAKLNQGFVVFCSVKLRRLNRDIAQV